jgi:hypothetical protein
MHIYNISMRIIQETWRHRYNDMISARDLWHWSENLAVDVSGSYEAIQTTHSDETRLEIVQAIADGIRVLQDTSVKRQLQSN